ncbi:MAG: hypothetical protein OEW02_13700 [Myxococcales bacterium]|nr:hypothetical protein [Myxococcales bacterium]
MRLIGLRALLTLTAALQLFPLAAAGLVTVGSIRTGSTSWGVAVAHGIAYVAGSCRDFCPYLSVFDVSDSAAPVRIGSLGPRGVAVEVVGNLAYIAGETSGLYVIDVSDPTAPVELGGAAVAQVRPNAMPTSDVAVAGGLAYVPDAFGAGFHVIDFGPEYVSTIAIEIDIKPGSDANTVNPASRGVLPVALLGAHDFDVADVDAATLRFGPGAAALAHREDPHPVDLNGDGFPDLLGHFRSEETGIAAGDTQACLRGETHAGAHLEGCDALRSVPGAGGAALFGAETAAVGSPR